MGDRYSLADIKARHTATGGHFFDRKTMRFFGDTMASFKARNWAGRTFVERVKEARSEDGLMTIEAGKLWEFDALSGQITPVLENLVPEVRALADLTLQSARQQLQAVGVTLTRREGEYRVNFLGGREETACYTGDLGDALATGLHMARERDQRKASE